VQTQPALQRTSRTVICPRARILHSGTAALASTVAARSESADPVQ